MIMMVMVKAVTPFYHLPKSGCVGKMESLPSPSLRRTSYTDWTNIFSWGGSALQSFGQVTFQAGVHIQSKPLAHTYPLFYCSESPPLLHVPSPGLALDKYCMFHSTLFSSKRPVCKYFLQEIVESLCI